MHGEETTRTAEEAAARQELIIDYYSGSVQL
jgi:hypothetical protein